jgi:hypothetical protein
MEMPTPLLLMPLRLMFPLCDSTELLSEPKVMPSPPPVPDAGASDRLPLFDLTWLVPPASEMPLPAPVAVPDKATRPAPVASSVLVPEPKASALLVPADWALT